MWVPQTKRETEGSYGELRGSSVEVMHVTSVYIPCRTQSHGPIQLQEELGNVVERCASEEMGLMNCFYHTGRDELVYETIESPDTNLYVYGKLIYSRGGTLDHG